MDVSAPKKNYMVSYLECWDWLQRDIGGSFLFLQRGICLADALPTALPTALPLLSSLFSGKESAFAGSTGGLILSGIKVTGVLVRTPPIGLQRREQMLYPSTGLMSQRVTGVNHNSQDSYPQVHDGCAGSVIPNAQNAQ